MNEGDPKIDCQTGNRVALPGSDSTNVNYGDGTS
jgi:hypothetical protein